MGQEDDDAAVPNPISSAITAKAQSTCKPHGWADQFGAAMEARNEVLHAYADHAKAHTVFGEPTGITLAEGIARMAAWAKKVGARQGQEFENIEITEKLPEGWNLNRMQNR